MAESIVTVKRISDTTILVLLGLSVTLFHVLTNGQYGFHRDELDIIMNARQLDWGYVAYPPLTPFIARVGLTLFGDSLRGLRLFSAIGQGLVVVLAGRTQTIRWLGWVFSWGILGVATVVGVVLIKPIAPINSPLWAVTSDVNGDLVEMVGWPDLVEQVAAIYADIPNAEKTRTTILAGNYGEAGALDLYGPQHDLPKVISGSNSLWARGYGDPEPDTVIVVGLERSYADYLFKSCQRVGRVSNRYGVKNEETTSHTGLYVCREPRRPWPEMWAEMQWFQ